LEARGLIQLSLFGDPERGPLLRAAIARIQDRFGEAAIVPAVSVVSRQSSVVSKDIRKRCGQPAADGQQRTPDAGRLATDDRRLTTDDSNGAPD